jgi:hypothetical protein
MTGYNSCLALLPFIFSAENMLVVLNLVSISSFTLSATDAKQHNVGGYFRETERIKKIILNHKGG